MSLDRSPLLRRPPRACSTRRGAVLVLALTVVTFLAGLAVAFFRLSLATQREALANADRQRARYLAEGALHEARAAFELGGRTLLDGLVWPRDFGGQSYDLTVTWGSDDAVMDDDLVRLRAEAVLGGETTALELTGRIVSVADELLGVVAASSLDMGDQVVVDSYDSSLGSYASQAVNSSGATVYAGTLAPVKCNGDVNLDQFASLWGDAHPGPAGSVLLGGSALVSGATTPLPEPLSFEAVQVPVLAPEGPLSASSGLQSFSGDHHFDSLALSGSASVVLTGPAQIVVGDLTLLDTCSLSIDDSGGPVRLYVTGAFVLAGSAVLEPSSADPAGLMLEVASSGPGLTLQDDARLTGMLYAPQRGLTMGGNAQLLGALAVDALSLAANAKLHFDQHLQDSGVGASEVIQVLCWRSVKAP